MINFILISSAIIIALYLVIILISFDPADPSWLQIEWDGSICNIGGIIGARFSDFLFFVFGILAYTIPLLIFLYLWRICIQKTHFTIFIILFELTGFSILLLICCSLLNLIITDFFYFSSGGIVGCILCNWVYFYENSTYNISLILCLIGILGITFFFNQSFLRIMKVIKKKLFNSIDMLIRKFFIKEKIRCQYIRCKLKDRVQRICPTVFFIKKNDCKKNTIQKSLKKQKFSNVFLNTSDFSKKINFNLENDYVSIKRINFSKILKKDNNLLGCQLKQSSLCSNYNNHKGKYVKLNFLRRKNFFDIDQKYNKKLCQNNKLSILKNKSCNINNNLLGKDCSLMHVINNNGVIQKIVPVKKNINQNLSVLEKSNISTEYHNSNDGIKDIIFPSINLLMESMKENKVNTLELKNISQLLEKKLAEYRVLTNVVNIVSGPIITRFELNLFPGMKSSKIVNLSRDLARSLSVTSVRVIEVIPGTPYVGLEIPNKKRRMVCLRDIINSDQFQRINTPLALALGQDISGNPIIEDLRRMPHLLIAGTTGSGKSVGINAMIISILYKAKPEEVRFIMIDPKILELSIYSSIPHILEQVITDMKDVNKTLQWCVQEMEHRYQLMAMVGVRNLENYNCHIEQLYSEEYIMDNFSKKFIGSVTTHFEKKLKKLPYIVVIVDEFADLIITSTKKIEELIIRLTQKARAAGIHLILATQRPSVNVITGLIKANIPARIAFTVSSKVDSHTILGQSGAESLLGMGDMLYLSSHSSIPIRVHGAYIRDQEVHAVVDFWKIK